MSTIKVNKIENTTTSAGGVAIDSSGHVQVDGVQMPSAGALSNRNKIINGDMRIDQRNAGSAVTASTAYPVDRWSTLEATSGAYSGQQVTDVPSGQGFVNSIKYTVTTAASTLGATEYTTVSYKIEGNDSRDLMLGTASAKTFTVSFWVKSSLTGNFGFALQNGASDRAFATTYSISAANTWEYKTITIAGDTTGTWYTDNQSGLACNWGLGIGSTYTVSANDTWESGLKFGASGAVALIETLNAEFYLTGVQLEVGEKATPFEHRSYGNELAGCQRYYQVMSGNVGNQIFCNMSAWSSSSMYGILYYQKPMRAAPTGSHSGTFEIYSGGTTAAVTDVDFERISIECCRIYAATSGMTTGRGGWMEAGAASDATIELSAEL